MRDYNSRRLLFDTNVLLDAMMEERPQSREAWTVLERCNGSGDVGLVCPMTLKDVYYVLGKGGHEEEARAAVAALRELLVIAPLGAEECELALCGNEPDFEDGLIRACAEHNEADFILTRDASAYQKSTVRSVTCAEYLEIVA